MKTNNKLISVLIAGLILLCIIIPSSITALNTSSASVDESYISAVSIKETITGLAPFDADDNAGNDSSPTNNIVRSFDNINYTLEYVTALKTQDAINEAYLYVEFIIPYTKEIATFDMDTMAWMEDPILTEENGQQILTGKRHLQNTSSNNIIPGTGTLSIGIKVQGASNQTIIKPSFKLWMEGNETSEKRSINSDEIIVSAAPKYNVQLTAPDTYRLNYLGYFNTISGTGGKLSTDGDIHGRMLGCGIVVQLYNDSADKGLKGIELPQGNIEFDLTLRTQKTTNTSTDVTFTEGYTPILWDYKVNNKNTDKGSLNRNMLWNGLIGSQLSQKVPYHKGTNDQSCYDSGLWNIEQTGINTYHISISNYKFSADYHFPEKTPDSSVLTKYEANIGCFSAGYIQFICQFPTEVNNLTNLYFITEISNLTATSINGNKSPEVTTTDNKNVLNLTLYPKGSISKYIIFQDERNNNLPSFDETSNGRSALLQGSPFIAYVYQTYKNSENPIKSINHLVKFDNNAFVPQENILNKVTYSLTTDDIGDLTILFAAKPDKTGWSNHSEMINAKEEDLVYFTTLKELQDKGFTPVALLMEARNCHMERSINILVNMKVKDDAVPNETYCMVNDLRLWDFNLDFSYTDIEYDYQNKTYPKNNASDLYVKNYPAPTDYLYTKSYTKTEYDNNGVMIPGTHAGGHSRGNTILIIDYKAEITKNIATLANNGSVKTVFDMDSNERIIDYSLSPKIVTSAYSDTNKTTSLYITDTLPKELTYIQGTSLWGNKVLEPQITTNSDGTTTLKWTLNNVIIGQAIDKINFKCTIGKAGTSSDVINNQMITNTVTITGDSDHRAHNTLNKNLSTVSFSVIKLSAISISKSTTTPFVSTGEDFQFTLKFANNSENPIVNSKLYDVLPYDEDDRDSDFSGFYKINDIVINFANAPKTFTDYINGTYTLNYTDNSSIQTSDFAIISSFDNWSEGSTKTIDETNKTVTYTGLPENIKALLFNMSLQGFEYVEITLNMSPTGNQQEGDAYINDFYQYANGQVEQVHSNQAVVQIYGTLNITKIWNDHDNVYDTRPNSLNISVLQNGNVYRVLSFNSDDAITGDFNKWNEIVREVPLYDSEGNPYVYTIQEDENNVNLQYYYYPPHYNQDTLTVTNTGIWLQIKPESLEELHHKITITKEIINSQGAAPTIADFENINLDSTATYMFPITLKQLNRTISKGETSMIESYNGYSGKIFQGYVTNKNSLVFFDIEAGKYEISEEAVQYFDFVNFTKLSASQGVTFTQENGKYYITISGLTSTNESIEVKVTNRIENARFYEDKNTKDNLFLINKKTGVNPI